MGILVQGKELWRVLFTRTRRRVLGLLFGHPDRSFYATEVVRLADVGTGSVQRELARLTEAGFLTTRRIGNQIHYQANADCPFFPEIRSMVVKTHGALALFRTAARGLEPSPELAFIHGPVVAGESSAPVDIVVVSEAHRRDALEQAFGDAASRVGREVRLTLLRPQRFRVLRSAADPRLGTLLAQPRIMLVGDPDDDPP